MKIRECQKKTNSPKENWMSSQCNVGIAHNFLIKPKENFSLKDNQSQIFAHIDR